MKNKYLTEALVTIAVLFGITTLFINPAKAKTEYDLQNKNIKIKGIVSGKIDKIKMIKEQIDRCVKNEKSWEVCKTVFMTNPLRNGTKTADKIAGFFDPYAERLERLEKRGIQNQRLLKSVIKNQEKANMHLVQKKTISVNRRKKREFIPVAYKKNKRRSITKKRGILPRWKQKNANKRKLVGRAKSNHNWSIENNISFISRL